MDERWGEEKVGIGWKQKAWLEEGWWGGRGEKKNFIENQKPDGEGGRRQEGWLVIAPLVWPGLSPTSDETLQSM